MYEHLIEKRPYDRPDMGAGWYICRAGCCVRLQRADIQHERGAGMGAITSEQKPP